MKKEIIMAFCQKGGYNAAKNVDRYVTKDMSKYEQRNSTW